MNQTNTQDAAKHFFQSRDWEEARHVVAAFCAVKTSTVLRWKKGIMPKGASLLRFRVLLDAAGYSLEEFDAIPEVTKCVVRLVALDLISLAGLQEDLRYKTDKDVYRVLLQGGGLQPDRAFRLERLAEGYKEEHDELLADLREKLAALSSADVPEVVAGEAPATRTDPHKPQGAAVPLVSVEEQVGPVVVEAQESASSKELMARALVDAVQLVTSLAQALEASSDGEVGLVTVNFALGQSNLNAAYQALGAIRRARD